MLIMMVFLLGNNNFVYATASVDPQLGQVYDWTAVLNDYSTHKNKVYTGPYYKIGIIGKHDKVEIGDDIKLEFRLVHNYTGGYKTKAQILNMQHTQYDAMTLENQVSVTVSTTIGQTSVAKLGLSLGDMGTAEVSQSTNHSLTLSTTTVYTESQITSNTLTYDFNLDVIPSDQLYFAYGKVAVYVRYKVKKSYRYENILWWWQEEASTVKTNYTAYKYLFDLDTFVYTNDTFGDTVSGVYSFGTFSLNWLCIKQ
ncbi:Uncharacterised protein [Acholeplasma hippikon]|uniref:Uncharacterized protein n=2 Tax=Acholeplasma hippikon TaxID=264636 RepID=A0A449BHY5_9MOLU|nr:Uncharacterised protein [Acholeplasma hippikon]